MMVIREPTVARWLRQGSRADAMEQGWMRRARVRRRRMMETREVFWEMARKSPPGHEWAAAQPLGRVDVVLLRNVLRQFSTACPPWPS